MNLSAGDPTFQHEYGRYLQSRADGFTYLTFTALPDLFSPGNGGPTETDGNARALLYFNKHYGLQATNANSASGTFGWYLLENPINDGYAPSSSASSPRNQRALERNFRRPKFLDFSEASSDFTLISLMLF